MEKIKLSVEDLLKLFKDLSEVTRSSESEEFYTKSPRHITLFNELLDRTSEELLTKDKFGEPVFYNHIFGGKNPNPLFIAAVLSKGVFVENLHKSSQWLLKNNTEDKSLDFFNLIGNFEYGITYDKNPDEQDKLLRHAFVFFAKMDTPEKTQLMDKFYTKFLTKKSAHTIMIEYIYDVPNSAVSNYLLDKMKEANIDMNKTNILNNMLPTEVAYKTKDDFFISSVLLNNLQLKLDRGFRFNEEKYTFYGKNLFDALLTCKQEKIIKMIVPYIKNFAPLDGNTETQQQVLESLKDRYCDGESLYNIVSPYYLKNILEQTLPMQEKKIKHIKV